MLVIAPAIAYSTGISYYTGLSVTSFSSHLNSTVDPSGHIHHRHRHGCIPSSRKEAVQIFFSVPGKMVVC